MAAITLRSVKGSVLSNAEVDANFTNLNTELGQKLVASSNLSDLGNAATARSNLGLGNVENKSSATIRSELTSSNVTTALGFTPYNSSNPAGYIAGITSSMVATALGYTPYSAANPSGYITSSYTGFMLRTGSSQPDPNTNFFSSAYRFDPNANNPTYEHYSVLTYGNENNVVGQLATHFTSGQTFTRAYNTSWSPWRTQLDSSNYSNYALPLSGGTLTGSLYLAASQWIYGRDSLGGGTRFVGISSSSDTAYFGSIDSAQIAAAYIRTGGVDRLYIGNTYIDTAVQLRSQGNAVLNASNYSSYALPLTGGTLTGNLSFSNSNPYITSGGSYIVIPNGAYFSGGTVYTENSLRARGGVSNDSGAELVLQGGTSGVTKVTGTFRAEGNSIRQGNNIARPLAMWAGAGSTTGMVYIELPGTSSNYGMIHAVIDVYEYSGNAAATIVVGGHNWNAGWYNASCNVIGKTDKQIRLAYRNGKYVICLGDASSSWSYGQVMLRKISNGSYYDNIIDMGAQFVVAQTTTESLTGSSGDLRQLSTPASFNAGGAITQAGNQVLHAANYSGYALPLSGGVVSGSSYFRKSQTAGDYTTAALWTESYDNTATGIAFHISGVVGRFLEMRTDAQLYWAGSAVLHGGNYSGYSTFSGIVSAGSGGFQTATYTSNARNRIWSFGNADAYGISYFQGSAGLLGGLDTIGIHMGAATAAASLWTFNQSDSSFRSSGPILQSGNQVLHAANYTNYVDAPNKAGTSYYQANTWIQFNGGVGGYGLYFPNSNAGSHIYPNADSYGSFYVRGYRNGFSGFMFESAQSRNEGWMTDGSTAGYYAHGTGWRYFHQGGNFHIFNGNYGGGTSYVALHSGNYTSYLNSTYLRAIGPVSSSNDWNSLGNTYPNTVEQVDPNNFSGTSNGPTAAGYQYGTLLNFSSQSSSQAQIYISHAGNDLVFRGGWSGSSWQAWNKVLTNHNYSSYALPLSGGTLSGTLKINTAGSGSSTSHVIIKRSGAGEPGSYGIYPGAWRSGIEVWNNDSTRMLFLNPPESDSLFSNIRSVGGGILVGVGSSGATLAAQINNDGTIYLPINGQGVGAATLVVNGDITAARGNGTSGVIYLGSSGSAYVYYDGANYSMPGGQLDVGSNRVLTAGNYSSYALPLSGGILSGSLLATPTGQSMQSLPDGYIGFVDPSHSSGWGVAQGIGARTGDAIWAIGSNGATGSSDTLYLGIGSIAGGTFSTALSFAQNGFAKFHNGLNIVGGSLQQAGNQVLHAGNYSSYALPLSGGAFTGRVSFNVNGRTTYYDASSVQLYTTDNTPPSLGFHRGGYSATTLYELNGELYTNPWTTRPQTGKLLAAGNYKDYVVDFFGSPSTSGTLDWNDVSNTKPGAFGTLLLGSAANGMGGSAYYHPLNFEYSSKDGTGNVTQMAIAYGLPGNELYMRGRYGGSWTSWARFLNSTNYSSYALPLGGGTLSGDITFSNGRKGLVGVYDAAQTQAVFAMGPSYKLTDGGSSSTYGNFYGLAWSYEPNYGGAGNNPQSKAGLSHQLLLMMAGVTHTAIGYGVWTSGAVAAGGAITQAGNQVLHAGNYSSYALPVGGGTLTGGLTIRNGSPTIYFQDTDSNSAFLHCNSNLFYILRGGTDASSWTQVNGYWPAYWDLTNNNATFGGSLWCAGNVTAYSDERVKANWSPLPEDFVERLARVKVGTFDRTDLNNERQVGVSAQSLREEVLPEAVSMHDGDGLLAVAYGNAALASAVELAKEVVRLRAEIEAIKALIRGNQ